jgi:antitoxin component YwqK of YwqJK toxin-antitoxin module
MLAARLVMRLVLVLAAACSRPQAPASQVSSPAPVAAPRAEPAYAIPSLSRGDTWLCRWNDLDECRARCDAGNALSCSRLAQHASDPVEKRALFRKACDGGYPYACAYLTAMLGPADPLARQLLAGACARDVAAACASLAGDARDATAARHFARLACELGDAASCIDAAEDTKGQLVAFHRGVRGTPIRTSALACGDGTVAMTDATGIGGPVLFCARADGTKHGAYVEWVTREDLDEGEPHGQMFERGTYVDGRREGPFTRWNPDGTVRSQGSFHDDREQGGWLVDGETGTFFDGRREGTWTKHEQGHDIATPYVHGVKEGELVDTLDGKRFLVEHYRAGKREGVSTTTWPNGQKCIDHYVDDQRDGTSTCWDERGRKTESRWSRGRKID